MTSETPRTEAGRELVAAWYETSPEHVRRNAVDDVCAIEDESWNAALAAVEQAVGTDVRPQIIETEYEVLAGITVAKLALAAIASLRKPVTP